MKKQVLFVGFAFPHPILSKYSDISENTLYKLGDAPFAADGDYTLTQLPEGFEQLPFDQMGRTYK